MIRPLVLAGVLLAAAAAGFFAYRHAVDGGDGSRIRTGTVAPAGDVRRPDFSLPDVDGRLRSIGEWDGRPLVVNFWATWCAPCRREIPLLMALQQAHDPKHLQVIGIAVDDAAAVRQYAAELGINYPVLTGEQEAIDVAEAFGVEFIGLPFTVFTDADGRVREMHLGELEQAEIDALTAEILAATRTRG